MFLYEIVTQIENMSDTELIEPKSTNDAGFEYIGNCSDLVKKLYTIRQQMKYKSVEAIGALIMSDDRETTHQHAHALQKHSTKAGIIDTLFWLELREDLSITECEYPNLQITKGWRVYAQKSE